MGGSPQTILVSQGVNYAAGIRRRHVKMSKRSRRIAMKRRSRRMVGGSEGSRRPRNEVGRRVNVLKKLIPSSSNTMGIDELFKDTADYILALEMRLKVMQIMVKALSNASDDDVDNNKY
ncbi:BHLH1 transcription factor [Heracleum sosnowskyi]|uniref:BHLH1 transcription factor n=1 Tax=Heracleum sosnowskyi TaxID=360622 RepID=A0AAD8IJG5_9APIA|nr:BHLH1 transcription factor [Heracleum sosnowskyi]